MEVLCTMETNDQIVHVANILGAPQDKIDWIWQQWQSGHAEHLRTFKLLKGGVRGAMAAKHQFGY